MTNQSKHTNVAVVGPGNGGCGGTFNSSGIIDTAGVYLDEFSIDPADAWLGIWRAFDALPANGGEVHIYGGPSDFDIKTSIPVTQNNVQVYFHGAQLVTSVTALSQFFEVTGRNVQFFYPRCQNLILEQDEFAFIRFNNSGGAQQAAGGAVFYGIFDVQQNDAATLMPSGIRVVGHATEKEARKYNFIGNDFICRTGTTQLQSRNGAAFPFGWVGIRAYWAIGMNISHNHFRGHITSGASDPAGNCGGGVLVESCRWVNITNNTFEHYDTADVGGDRNPPILLRNRRGEGGHINISGNLSENVGSSALIEGYGLRFAQIYGNNFGRNLTGAGLITGMDTVEGGSTPVQPCETVVVTANNFHNPSLQVPCIQIKECESGLVANNAGTLLHVGVPFIEVDEASAGVVVHPSNITSFQNV